MVSACWFNCGLIFLTDHNPHRHLWNHKGATSVADDVLFRWLSDRQHFPPRACEAGNLVSERFRSTSGGRLTQRDDWPFVVFLSQLWMKSWEVSVAWLKLEETPLDKVFICRSPLSLLQPWRWNSMVPHTPCERISTMAPQSFSCVDVCTGQFSTRMLFAPFLD